MEGFRADSRNVQSHKAILRIGAQQEGILRKYGIMQDGYIRDANIYSMIDSEWDAAKGRFERELLR
ncbi:GNAT family N-acetyltransferase [Paenibacillus lemnae]|uniref:GNAT family N-acetyltransferase n=1 Tax=Paenibacillus lemnae TaxID=1330551 RepID=A0A848ME54_PAELE|nr:GNAT family protein [Paenibacillus lemnae]NMO97684.1 GNAT family N-acetyltransferase [Paenibacillus lemnae]